MKLIRNMTKSSLYRKDESAVYSYLTISFSPRLQAAIAHLGNPSREQRSHFAVYFSAGFSDKTVHPATNLTAEGHSSGGDNSESVSAPRPPDRKDTTV